MSFVRTNNQIVQKNLRSSEGINISFSYLVISRRCKERRIMPRPPPLFRKKLNFSEENAPGVIFLHVKYKKKDMITVERNEPCYKQE